MLTTDGDATHAGGDAPLASSGPRVVVEPVPLVLTGERTLPGIDHENYWFRRHEAAYVALAPFTPGALLVEAGCGEGYGAEMLARGVGRAPGARRVVAVDADPSAAAHVRRTYPGIEVLRADLERLPLPDGSVDVVATLQVIEHLHDQSAFLAECARVLRPAGTLLVTTPNRITFSPGRDTPLNPFHTRELSAAELAELLEPHFVTTRMGGLHHGRSLRRWEARHGGIVDAQLASAPQQWAPALRQRVTRLRSGDFDVRLGDDVGAAPDVDASLDLVAVAWRRP